MTKLKALVSIDSQNFPKILFVVFLFLHLGLMNINSAEWGDSYRILRASEYVRDFTYPSNEKRPPLFSVMLAVRPANVDQVLWGRSIMFFLSLLSFFAFQKLLDLWKVSLKVQNIALLLFVFNPVLFYWSLRIMADMPFMLFSIYSFIFFEKYAVQNKFTNLVLSSIFVGLSVLLRFEGYILFFSLFIGFLLKAGFRIYNFRTLLECIRQNYKAALAYVFVVVVVVLPYWVVRNPFNSSYFSEPSGREYNFETIAIYVFSLLFVYGWPFAFYFILNAKKQIWDFILNHPGISVFVLIELVLVLVWPAAVPRLFTAIVPILCLYLAIGITEYLNNVSYTSRKSILIWLPLLLLSYLLGQYLLKLQFLVLIKPMFFLVLLLSFFQIITIYLRRESLFLVQLTLIMFLWTVSTIWLHKDIFKVVQQGNIYIVDNLQGKIGYNDVSSVSNWYLNDSRLNDNVSGVYYNLIDRSNAKYTSILEENLDYVLVTNEHNTDLKLDLEDKPYLEEVVSFEEVINSKLFFTKILRFNKIYE